MADSNALALAKKLAVLDTTLTTNIANFEAPALILMNKQLSDLDYSIYNNTVGTITISSFSQGEDTFTTLCQCSGLADAQFLENGQEIVITTTSPATTYDGKFKIQKLDKEAYNFEIQKIYSVTKTAAGVLSRKTELEAVHAFFILYLTILAAQELVSKQVMYSSNSFGEGAITQADVESKKAQAKEYYKKAVDLLNYNMCEII